MYDPLVFLLLPAMITLANMEQSEYSRVAAIKIDQRNLLKAILDEPDVEFHKLAYADVLEELNYNQHAAYVRRISNCRWNSNELVVFVRGDSVLLDSYVTVALMTYRNEWKYYRSRKDYKQRWTFHIGGNEGTRSQRWYGAATNTHNLKRRVMIELMTCRKRNCLCGRGMNDEHEKEKNP